MNLWCNEQIVVSIDGPEGSHEIVVPAPLVRIGAHPESDVVLGGIGDAKRALYLHATSVGIYVLNLDLEDANLEQLGRWLQPADVLTIGEYRLRARTSGALVAPVGLPELVARGSSPPPVPVLNVYCGRLLKDKRRFRAQLSLLGRRPQCSLRLRGARVSSFHCALYWEQRRLWCIDLLSSNGTQLNGAPLRCEEVKLNDRLEVGEFELEYHRWSPRRSMAPGWHPATEATAADDDPLSSADALADAPVVSGDRPAESGSSVIGSVIAPERQLREQLAEKVTRLTSERLDLQRQFAEASQQLAARIDKMQAESVKLSQVRAALKTARAQWQAERASLNQKLANRSEQLAHLEEEVQVESVKLSQERAAHETASAQWHTERESLTQELASRSGKLAQLEDEVEVESLKLSQERAAHEMARAQWRTERESLTQELVSRSVELARLEDEVQVESVKLSQERAAHETARAQWQTERASLTKDAASEQQRREQLADEIARLTSERLDLKQQLAARNDELQAESINLSQERAAHETARKQWQTERASLVAELASRSEPVARRESELAAATSVLARRLADEKSFPSEVPAASHNAEMPPAGTLLPEVALPEEAIPAEALPDEPFPLEATQLEPLSQPAPLPIAEGAPDWNAGQKPPAPVEEPARAATSFGEAETLIVVPSAVGRSSKPTRQEMSTFVSDRLRELQHTKRHNTLVLVAAIGAAALTISAALVGAWMWLH